MKPYAPLNSEDRYFPIYLSRETIATALYSVYVVLIGISFVTGFFFSAILLHHRQTFHFSFHLILLQIVWCGIAKCLIRAISTVDFEGLHYLYAIELMFDFGLLLFIVSMTFNRFFVVVTPTNCFIYTNKILQCIFAFLIWICAIIAMVCFITRQCMRSMYEDGRLFDNCIDLFKDDFEENNYGDFTPIVFVVRRAVYVCYDFLPLSCVILYFIATLVLTYKRRLFSQPRHTEWKVLLHGILIFVVYGA
ncbi:hypothetical protein PENTCL1PPCAC_17465 [Pristionchus entomophagus]|uniref:G protein-coupled receptor n=1 Tax=Pristionchus entomophagus TaxID=358040 RepID=A0AAV5TLP3_9BILA|nr:hypothetical protein PENTCL1PPCAC_17465 [Pristionchus entomophagus]